MLPCTSMILTILHSIALTSWITIVRNSSLTNSNRKCYYLLWYLCFKYMHFLRHWLSHMNRRSSSRKIPEWKKDRGVDSKKKLKEMVMYQNQQKQMVIYHRLDKHTLEGRYKITWLRALVTSVSDTSDASLLSSSIITCDKSRNWSGCNEYIKKDFFNIIFTISIANNQKNSQS